MSSLYPLKDALDDSHQFLRLERLCDVGIYTGAKSCDAVCGLIFGGEEDNRYESTAR